jgi:hypothetical protein
VSAVRQLGDVARDALHLEYRQHLAGHLLAKPPPKQQLTGPQTPLGPGWPNSNWAVPSAGFLSGYYYQTLRMLMRKIYVSDSGNDIGDGLIHKTPIRSWKRFIELCEGNDEIIIMGNADTGKMRLIAEIDKKGRIAQGEVAPKAS